MENSPKSNLPRKCFPRDVLGSRDCSSSNSCYPHPHYPNLTNVQSTCEKFSLDWRYINERLCLRVNPRSLLWLQVFYFICANSLNILLLRKDMCYWTKGMQMRYNRRVCLCLCLPVSVSLSLSLFVSVCLSLFISVCLCLPLFVSVCLFCLPVCLCLSATLCLSLMLSVSVCLSVT